MRFSKGANDFSTSLEKALGEIDPDWRSYEGTLVFGSHDQSDVDGKLRLIREARKGGIPFLGVCFGLHLMVVEYLRSRGIDADSEEIDPSSPNLAVVRMPELRVGIRDVAGRKESHWHNYQVNPLFLGSLGEDFDAILTEDVPEMLRHRSHPFFVGVQFHPEYGSTKTDPHPLLVEFLQVCRDRT